MIDYGKHGPSWEDVYARLARVERLAVATARRGMEGGVVNEWTLRDALAAVEARGEAPAPDGEPDVRWYVNVPFVDTPAPTPEPCHCRRRSVGHPRGSSGDSCWFAAPSPDGECPECFAGIASGDGHNEGCRYRSAPTPEPLADVVRRVEFHVESDKHPSDTTVIRRSDAKRLLAVARAAQTREDCHMTFNGGYTHGGMDEQCRAFHHGMDTVFNVLEATVRGTP